jgi:threonine/homoserine/homoserine lactone efflux protein
MIIQLAIAALGTATLVTELHNGLLWLKWAGAAYLLVMGISALRRLLAAQAPAPLSGMGSFRRGFLVSLTNPKTILFFSAFLPQFVSPQANYGAQITVLSCWFWLLATVLDLSYVMTAQLLKERLARWHSQRAEDGLSAAVYLGASGLLALSSGKN